MNFQTFAADYREKYGAEFGVERYAGTSAGSAQSAARAAMAASDKAKESGSKEDHREAAKAHFHASGKFRGMLSGSNPIGHNDYLWEKIHEHQAAGQRHVSSVAGKDITGSGKYEPYAEEEDQQGNYDNAMDNFRKVSAAHTAAQKAYRARTIGDDEFLKHRKALDEAGKQVDEAEKRLTR